MCWFDVCICLTKKNKFCVIILNLSMQLKNFKTLQILKKTFMRVYIRYKNTLYYL